jgi:hypothetical protein
MVRITFSSRLVIKLARFKERQARKNARKKARAVQKNRTSARKHNRKLRRAWCLEHKAELLARKKRARFRKEAKALLRIVRQSMKEWA